MATLARTRRRSGLSRRRKTQLWRATQYAVFVAAVAGAALLADWSVLTENFARPEYARQMFPELVTVALRNTVVYTLAGFAFGLVLGLAVALMRLSTAAPYRWVAMVYIEIFRGLPALVIFILVGVGLPLAFPGLSFPGGTYGKVAFALGLVS
ncbi:MAG TPA: ABC transporter permease subunit, partial [Gemmatimonadales bacterium]|nr:ABC transporter permease subunit [Gemmatimonadales bacterium]